jgi:Bacteriophage lysis protein.
MNPIAKYLIAICVFAAYTYGVYEFGVSNKGTKDQLTNAGATITQTQTARSTEQAMVTDTWKIDAAYQKGVLEGRQSAQTLTNSLLSGSVGMYVPKVPTTPAVSGTAAPTVKSVAETQCRLPGQTAADLTNLARDADDRVRQANALVDYYEDVIRRLGHPELTRQP